MSNKDTKDMTTTVVLAIVVAGVGHIYLGKIKRGILILAIFVAVPSAISTLLGVEKALGSNIITESMFTFVALIVLGIGMFSFFIWQIFDARRLCREYNNQ